MPLRKSTKAMISISLSALITFAISSYGYFREMQALRNSGQGDLILNMDMGPRPSSFARMVFFVAFLSSLGTIVLVLNDTLGNLIRRGKRKPDVDSEG